MYDHGQPWLAKGSLRLCLHQKRETSCEKAFEAGMNSVSKGKLELIRETALKLHKEEQEIKAILQL